MISLFQFDVPFRLLYFPDWPYSFVGTGPSHYDSYERIVYRFTSNDTSDQFKRDRGVISQSGLGLVFIPKDG